jgi:uncharacterized protein (DUF952 family)
MKRIFHITSASEARRATESNTYKPSGFDREGFIHCSYQHQLREVANRIFYGRDALVILEIDPARLPSAVVAENLEGGTDLFPHIYGLLPMTAVVAIHELPRGPDGLFELPGTVQCPPEGEPHVI